MTQHQKHEENKQYEQIEVLYQDRWLTLDTVRAQRADGSTYPHRRLVTAGPFGAVVIPRVTLRGVTYYCLVQQDRPAAGITGSLEFPRGGTKDLSAEEALRELAEETTLTGGISLLGVIRPDTGLMSTQVGVWLAGVTPQLMDTTEGYVEHESGTRSIWLSAGELASAITWGRVTCGMSIAALGLLHVRRMDNVPL